MRTSAKLGLLASLYISQGLPFGFFTQALPVLMRERGLALPDIGLANLLALPWALKFLWAPLVDRHHVPGFGRRRSWIVPLQILSVLVTAALAFVDPRAGLTPMMVALFCTNLLAATQDIATDGLAVEVLEGAERGYGNSVQVAGYRVGMILGGGFLLVVFAHVGYAPTYLSMAAMLAIATVPILLHRERAVPAPAAVAPLGVGAWIDALRRPRMGTWLVVLAVYKGGEALAYGMVKPLLFDSGFGLDEIGLLLGVVGFGAGLAGAVLGGVLVSRVGRPRALLIAGGLQLLGILAYVAPAAHLGGRPALIAASVVEHLTGGMATVSLFTIMMDVCGEAAATDYTLQASVVVIATGLAATLSGFVAARLGYAGHFALAAALSALGLLYTARAMARGLVPPVPAGHPEPALDGPQSAS
jgi:RhtX/FptX family siderophore transporter